MMSRSRESPLRSSERVGAATQAAMQSMIQGEKSKKKMQMRGAVKNEVKKDVKMNSLRSGDLSEFDYRQE